MFSIIKDRLPGKAKYLVLKYLRMGIIELDHVIDSDMAALARRHFQARRLRAEIQRLQEASWRRREERLNAWLE